MDIIEGIVFFCCTWTLVFFIHLPLGITSQHESGEVEPGTPASAPTDSMILRKMRSTTYITVALFLMAFVVIYFRLFTLDDIPFLTPPMAR